MGQKTGQNHGRDHDPTYGADPISGVATVNGHVIEDEGTPLTQRANMNFAGTGVTVTDSGGKTVVTIPTSSPWDATITKSIDQSVTSSTTPIDDTELTFVPALGTYVWECELAVNDTHSGAGIKFSWGTDTTTRGSQLRLILSAGTAVTAASEYNLNTINSFVPTSADDQIARFWGWFYCSSVSPSQPFKLKWAQNSSSVTATTVRALSQLRYRKVT